MNNHILPDILLQIFNNKTNVKYRYAVLCIYARHHSMSFQNTFYNHVVIVILLTKSEFQLTCVHYNLMKTFLLLLISDNSLIVIIYRCHICHTLLLHVYMSDRITLCWMMRASTREDPNHHQHPGTAGGANRTRATQAYCHTCYHDLKGPRLGGRARVQPLMCLPSRVRSRMSAVRRKLYMGIFP